MAVLAVAYPAVFGNLALERAAVSVRMVPCVPLSIMHLAAALEVRNCDPQRASKPIMNCAHVISVAGVLAPYSVPGMPVPLETISPGAYLRKATRKYSNSGQKLTSASSATSPSLKIRKAT